MANYELVVNSKFQPFSFERYIQPYQIYGQAYKEAESALEELSTKADVWEKMANEQADPQTYKMYKAYSDDLKKQADLLASEGLNAASRKDMLNMKSRYSKEIVPIEQAYKRRQELIDEQRKALMANPSLMYDVDFRTTSLDDLIANPNMSYSSVSGDDLYKKGKEAAIAASSRMLEIDPALKGQYWRIRQGYGADAANQFLLDQSSIPELKDAVGRIVAQSNVSKDNINRATDYVISGIMSGMSYKEDLQANRAFTSPAEQERINLAKDQFEWTKDKWEDEQLGAKLPNGNRVKDIGGGRVRITSPDGTVKIMAAPKAAGTTTKGTTGKAFPGLQFKMWNNSNAVPEFQEGLSNKWSYKRKGFSARDEELISPADLSPAMQTNLASKLSEYGLTFDDVEIWMDEDNITDNHYQVRLKPNKPNTPQTPEGFGDL